MRLIALADLPDHTKAGEAFDANPVLGGILIRSGAAREAEDAQPEQPKRIYRRRDLVAED